MTADEARKATKKGAENYAKSCVGSILKIVEEVANVGGHSVDIPPSRFTHDGLPSDAVMDRVCKKLHHRGYAVSRSYKGEKSSTLKFWTLMVSWK